MTHLKALLVAATLLASGVAFADAHHQIISKGPIVVGGKVVGFRARVLLDPQNVTSNHATLKGDVRIGLGKMTYNGSKVGNDHRDANAGVRAGYILHQFKMRKITGPKATDRGTPTATLATGGKATEVEIEVLYKDNPKLKPGMKVDLVAAFWKGSYWHPWGAADSATNSTQDFVITLPGAPTQAAQAKAPPKAKAATVQ